MPKFSVVIPLYNKEEDIKRTVMSVLAQYFSDFEVVIIDDGSTDNSLAIVKKFNDPRISVISKKNEGVSIARNFGVENAKSEYIAFLDADDYWYPEHLENFLLSIKKFPNHSWFANAYEKKRTLNLTTPMESPIRKKGSNWRGEVENYFYYSLIDSLAWSSSVCFKKVFFNSLNGFNSSFTHGEDTDLWIRAALSTSLVFSNKITSTHNLVSKNRSIEININNRNQFNLDQFNQEEKKNIFLKKYLDLNRYSLAILYKIAGNKENFKIYSNAIDLLNLNKKQRFLLKQDKFILKLLLNIKSISENYGFRLSSFK